MKKVICAILAAAIMLACTACGVFDPDRSFAAEQPGSGPTSVSGHGNN